MQIKLTTGSVFEVREGETLHNALKRQGVYLVSSCGGKGICGKCRLRILEGRYHTESALKLKPEEIAKGIVLACQTFADEDLSVDVPKESMLVVGDVIEISRTRELYSLFKSFETGISPLVKQVNLDIPAPTLDNNISDLERLSRRIEESGIPGMEFSHDFVSELPAAVRDAGWKTRLAYELNPGKNPAALFITPQKTDTKYGIAVDVGTTTVVLYLVDMRDGSIADTGSTYNSQIRFGDDVITRIVQATEGGLLEELRDAVIDDINALLLPLLERHNLSAADIESAVIAGNTTMSHLFWGINPQFIREEPYTPVLNSFPVWRAGTVNLSINRNAPVYTLPGVASYVGGDIVAGVIASGMNRKNRLLLFMDIGTNGEIVLGNGEWLVTTACSAGPCFEGSGIRCGMRATEGAIESVSMNAGTFEPVLGVIGNRSPLGICGSGMIDAITELFLNGLIDPKGKLVKDKSGSDKVRDGFEGPEFVLYSDNKREILLTEVDIENILRAKAAIFAGVSLLLKETGFGLEDVETVYIAGGFGTYLNVEKAILIGMLPDIPKEKFRFLGNTSIAGAYLCLLSEKIREEAEEVARKMTNIELSVSRGFMDEYMSALFLPHTNIDLFPTVKEMLKRRG